MSHKDTLARPRYRINSITVTVVEAIASLDSFDRSVIILSLQSNQYLYADNY